MRSRWAGPHRGAGTGRALAFHDLDGDGVAELIVGSPGRAAPAAEEGELAVYTVP